MLQQTRFSELYIPADSPLHRLRALWKLLLLLLFGIVTSFLHELPLLYLFVAAGTLGFFAALSQIPVKLLLVRLLTFELFTIAILILTLFQPQGVFIFTQLFLKSLLLLFAMLLFSATTSITQLQGALRQLRMPPQLVTVIGLTYRYLFVLADEQTRLRRAKAARSIRPTRRRDWSAAGALLSELFLRATRRSERVHQAMLARGWRL